MHFETSAFNLGKGDFSIILGLFTNQPSKRVHHSRSDGAGVRGNEGTANVISRMFDRHYTIRCTV